METVLITLICCLAGVQAVKIICVTILESQKHALELGEPENEQNNK